jgi:3-isopropylmalate dehydrogenase
VVGSNLFGDILSDLGPAVAGSIGIAASANINPEKAFPSMFEPVHGSAPDIAGKGLANPIAMLASFGMALRYSFDMGKEADLIDKAIIATLDKGLRTADIKSEGCKLVSTQEMGEAIIGELEKLATA